MNISPRKLIQEPQMRSCSSHLSNKNVLSSFRNESKLNDGSFIPAGRSFQIVGLMALPLIFKDNLFMYYVSYIIICCRWYHGFITRVEAENRLQSEREGSYLIRSSESNRLDYSLSVRLA